MMFLDVWARDLVRWRDTQGDDANGIFRSEDIAEFLPESDIYLQPTESEHQPF